VNVFILGGTGFVGRHLVSHLASMGGFDISVGTRYGPGARELAVAPRTRIVDCNPYDLDSLTGALDGHDAVINLVGILNERGFGGRGFHRAHVELVERLIISCEAARIRRLIHMSALNAGSGSSHYLKTRGQAEALIAAAQRDGQLRATIFQSSTIFGPDDSFLNRFATLLKLTPLLPLARPRARFAPVYVGDVVEAFGRALQDEMTHCQTYQLCGSEIWELRALVCWLRDQLGLSRWVVGLPDLLGRLQGLAFDLVPGKPFSSDNYRSLLVDSVCSENGFAALGIAPWGLSELAPVWLTGETRQARYQAHRRRARRGES